MVEKPDRYTVTISLDVSSDAYRTLQKRIGQVRELAKRTIDSDPNKDGFYIKVHDVQSSIRPKVLEEG